MANTVQANIEVNAKANTEGFDKVTQAINAINEALKNTQKELNSMSSDQLGGMSVSADMVAESLNRIHEGGSAFKEFQSDLNDTNNELKKTNEEADNSSKSFGDFSNVLVLLGKHFGMSNSEAASFAKALGASATEAAAAGVAIGVIVGVLKLYVDRLHEAENALVKFGEGALDAGASGVKFFIDAIHNLVDSLEEAMEKMSEFAEKGAEIQTAYFNTFTVLGSEAGNEVMDFADKLQNLYGIDGSQLVMDMQSIVAAAGSLGVSTGDAVKATENMTIMANNLSMIAGSFEKASNDIGNAISKGFVGRSSSLYVLMTKEEKEALRDLGSEVERYNYLMSLSGRIKDRYVQYLGTEAGQLMLLRNQYGQLIGNISQLALGLYAKIAPVLTKLIQLANIALTFIMKVFNIDLKGSADIGTSSIADGISNSMKKAGDSSKKAAKDIKKSTKDTSKSIKELERQVASFDDVIQIKDNKANDDTLGLDDFGDIDAGLDDIGDFDNGIKDLIGDFDLLGDAIDNTNHDWDDFLAKLEAGDYYGAGQEIVKWLKDMMESIPWDSIQAKARKFGAAMAELLNAFVDDEDLWKDIGHTIAQALNTAVDFLLNFSDLFHFEQFGKDLGIAWKQFWDEFDEVEAAQALYQWFMGIFDMVGAFFGENPLSTMANSIVLMFHNFFNNFDEEDKQKMAETIKNILNDVFNAALILAEGLFEDSDKILEFINNFLDSIVDWLENGGDDKIEAIGQAIIGILQKVKDSGLIEKIKEIIVRVMDDINLSDILSLATDIAFDVWKAKIQLKAKLLWEEVKSIFKSLDIPGAIKTLGELILAGIVWLGAYVWQAVKNLWDFGEALAYFVKAAQINLSAFWSAILLWITAKLYEIWTNIWNILLEFKGNIDTWLNELSTGIELKWEWIKTKAEAIWASIKQKLDEIKQGLSKWWNDRINDVSTFFTNLINKVREKFNSILTTVKEWIGKIKDAIVNPFKNLNPFSGMNFKLPSFNISMPYSGNRAVGGVTNGPSIARVGEAGREAILPLDIHNEWMDTLVDKVVNAGGNSGSPIVIDMKNVNKDFYTKAELIAGYNYITECLKAGGRAVSFEY